MNVEPISYLKKLSFFCILYRITNLVHAIEGMGRNLLDFLDAFWKGGHKIHPCYQEHRIEWRLSNKHVSAVDNTASPIPDENTNIILLGCCNLPVASASS